MPRLPPRKQHAADPASPDAPGATNSEAPEASTPDTPRASQDNSSGSSRRAPSPRQPLMRLGQRGGRRLPLPPGLQPPEPPSVIQEKALAGLLAYTGMTGTVAAAISYFTPGLDLFGNIHWSAPDVLLGLQLMLPVYLMNVAILLPNYSTWKIPEMTPESQQQMADTLQQWRDQKVAAAASSASTPSSSSSSSGAAPATAKAASPAAADGARSTQPLQQQQQATTTCSSSAEATHPVAHASKPPAAAPLSTTSTSSSSTRTSSSQQQLKNQGWLDRALQSGPACRMKDALFLAQGHYLSLNQSLLLPPAAQAGLLLAECLAAELLYRSVALQLTGGWLADRLYEGGAEDLLSLATAGLPVLPTHSTAGQLLAVGLLSGAWAVTVARRVQRLSRKPALALAAQGRQQAGRLLTDTMTQAAQQQRQQQQQEESGAADTTTTSSSSSSSSSPTPAASDNSPCSSSGATQQQQPSPSRAAADLATAAAARDQQGGGAGSRGPVAPPQPQQQWARRTMPGTMSALALSTVVQGVRDVSQMTALGFSFALTGNLAAPLAAAVINQVLLSGLQHHGVRRARERSMAIAKQLAGLARSLRDIQRRKEAQRQQQQEQTEQLAAVSQPQALATSATAATAGEGLPMGHAEGSSSDVDSTGAAVSAAAAATCADDDAAAAAAAAAPRAVLLHPKAPAGGAVADDARQAFGSRMAETINALDQLLGPELAEHATAGK